ncbi:hypothetical protein [Thalassoroseus pseudoceratinae]|uniref:hypothetical protein n=1 Tax=Thalassoroseus pseudoceratinae TaxID=2713176 RepID=UPI001420B28D|nr:hypothetical protein [Thalassoroseus pseudoceratinae]
MSEAPKTYWYHNGWHVLAMVITVIIVTNWLYQSWQQGQKPLAVTEVYGGLQDLDSEQPVLHLTLYHCFPGVLRNGRVTVSTPNRLLVVKSDHIQSHAFEEWQPNDEHSLTFVLQLANFHEQNRIPLTIRVEAENARVFQIQAVWQGDGWASNRNR